MQTQTATSFEELLCSRGHTHLRATRINTLQVNLGKYCNQTCRHCHVDAGPNRRTEQMSKETMDHVLHALTKNNSIETVDLTGGAPELNTHFRYFVEELGKIRKNIIIRSNLTVFLLKGQDGLAKYVAERRVRIIASLPCYLESAVDDQRGRGVHAKSIVALRSLNQFGYGREGTGLELDLVYNPIGATLPPAQSSIETKYKDELYRRFGIYFNRLFVITNMPIARFKEDLLANGNLDSYHNLLVKSFNDKAVSNLMCRSMISISWDGWIFDCDFNQMLDMHPDTGRMHIREFSLEKLSARRIVTGDHCYGCTAGNGSSCKGALV